MIYVKNVAQVQNQMKAWMAKREKEAAEVAKGLATYAFENLLRQSPQFSGDFAANWKVAINQVDYSFEKWPGSFPNNKLFSMGDSPAQDYSRLQNAGKLSSFKLGDMVCISNSSSHDEAYAVKIENGTIKFRDVNRAGGNPMAKTLQRIGQQWGTISDASAKTLAKKKL